MQPVDCSGRARAARADFSRFREARPARAPVTPDAGVAIGVPMLSAEAPAPTRASALHARAVTT
jgi:hypothetical protein